MPDLIGQMTQKVKMNGAARNGIGSHLAMATVIAATMQARIGTAIHSAVSTTKKLPSARPMSPELNPSSPSPSSVRSPPSSRPTSVPRMTEMT